MNKEIKEKIKQVTDEKGITMISLGIGIIVLMIIGSLAYTASMDTLKFGNKTSYMLELEIMQVEVDRLNALMLNEKTIVIDEEEFNGIEILQLGENLTNEQETIVENIEENEEKRAGYRYFSIEYLEKLGVSDAKMGIILNIETRSVIASLPYAEGNEEYFTLEQLGGGKYIVENATEDE